MSSVIEHSFVELSKSDLSASCFPFSTVCVVVKNSYLGQTHYLCGVDPNTQYHNLLIKYCKNHNLDVSKFVFLTPTAGVRLNEVLWKIAMPSVRISDDIAAIKSRTTLKLMFDYDEKRLYLQCVPKHDVPKFVTWNNCDSKKFVSASKPPLYSNVNTVNNTTQKKKRRAPPPPPPKVPQRTLRGSCTSVDFTQISGMCSGDTEEICGLCCDTSMVTSLHEDSRGSSQWSIMGDYVLKSLPPTIRINQNENYDEYSASEKFFTPGSPSETYKCDNLTEKCEKRESTPAFEDTHSEKDSPVNDWQTNGDDGCEIEMIKPLEIPTVGQSSHGSLTKSEETTPNTPPQLSSGEEKLSQILSEIRISKGSDAASKISLSKNYLVQARSQLRSISPRRTTIPPLRSCPKQREESETDRSRVKDWNGRFWCMDSRSRILSFFIDEK